MEAKQAGETDVQENGANAGNGAAPSLPDVPLLNRPQREDFMATGDPALEESTSRGRSQLLDYRQLYELWERQQWATQDLDFTQDRIDWHERIPADERFARMYGLSAFFIGEQKVTDELGPLMRACPTEDQRIFLSTQIADEARHVRFFDRFYSEVGVLESEGLSERLVETGKHVNQAFEDLFDDMLRKRVDRCAAEPEDRVALVEAITLYHMVIEGVLALTGQHFIIDYNEQEGTLPAFCEGFNKVARDEHRHVAFGALFLTEMASEDDRYRAAIQRMLEESLPVADKVLDPPWAKDDEDWEMFGVSKTETHAFAAECLTRRLKVIGLVA
jgi:ribonucleoside-diphosphate reductase beta chain